MSGLQLMGIGYGILWMTIVVLCVVSGRFRSWMK